MYLILFYINRINIICGNLKKKIIIIQKKNEYSNL